MYNILNYFTWVWTSLKSTVGKWILVKSLVGSTQEYILGCVLTILIASGTQVRRLFEDSVCNSHYVLCIYPKLSNCSTIALHPLKAIPQLLFAVDLLAHTFPVSVYIYSTHMSTPTNIISWSIYSRVVFIRGNTVVGKSKLKPHS
jgi:hypothetical protein